MGECTTELTPSDDDVIDLSEDICFGLRGGILNFTSSTTDGVVAAIFESARNIVYVICCV